MLTLVLLGQLACPTTADWTSDTLALPSGCPAPGDGRLYRPEAHDAMRAEAAQASALVTYLDEELARTRQQRDRVLLDCAEDVSTAAARLSSVEAVLAAVPEPPSRLAWLSGGALGGAALVAALVLVVR